MAKRYIADVQDLGALGTTGSTSATKSSGPQKHLLNKGPTIGLAYDYSGAVTGNVLYRVDNGSTLGEQESST